MAIKSACSHLSAALRRFFRAREGNVAMTFALALIPIIGFIGAAVDFSRANAVKGQLQSALDSTALMLSKEAATDTSNQLKTNALTYFKSLFTATDTTTPVVTASYSGSSGSSVLVKATVKVPTTFMRIFGDDYITLSESSTAAWGSSKMQVALVLDNTGSMAQSSKMSALKTASHNLLTTLQNAAQNPGDVEVAIIPFSNGVNVGTSNVAATWLNWSYYSQSGGWSHGGSYYDYGGGSYGTYDDHDGGFGGSGGGSYGGSYSSWGGSWYGGGGSSTGNCTWSSCWHMWNGPAGKCFLQTIHPAGTVQSYVRPFSAAFDRWPR